MPLYDYFCPKCGVQKKDVFHKLDEPSPLCCGVTMEKDLGECNKRDWFRPHWNENLDDKPIYVESKGHYRKLCAERGLTAKCLL